jgi:hypothetical protein
MTIPPDSFRRSYPYHSLQEPQTLKSHQNGEGESPSFSRLPVVSPSEVFQNLHKEQLHSVLQSSNTQCSQLVERNGQLENKLGNLLARYSIMSEDLSKAELHIKKCEEELQSRFTEEKNSMQVQFFKLNADLQEQLGRLSENFRTMSEHLSGEEGRIKRREENLQTQFTTEKDQIQAQYVAEIANYRLKEENLQTQFTTERNQMQAQHTAEIAACRLTVRKLRFACIGLGLSTVVALVRPLSNRPEIFHWAGKLLNKSKV